MLRTSNDDSAIRFDDVEVDARSKLDTRDDAALGGNVAVGGERVSTTAVTLAPPDVRDRAEEFITYLETGDAAPGLFAPDVFLDVSLPRWRLQAKGRDDALKLRRMAHPFPGRVPRSRFDATSTGFVLELEETWEDGGDFWYCRELFRADAGPEGIVELAVYCTGDWDTARVAEHAAAVALIRP
jgi:hypothetical protein